MQQSLTVGLLALAFALFAIRRRKVIKCQADVVVGSLENAKAHEKEDAT